MNKVLATLALVGSTVFPGLGYADENRLNNSKPLEVATVTIRMIGNSPFAELRPCPESCPLRLLPFASGAQVYIQGHKTPLNILQDGQILVGTVFLRDQPTLAIHDIIAD